LSRMFLPLLEHVPLEATMPGLKIEQALDGSSGADWCSIDSCQAILKGDDEWLKAVAIWTSRQVPKERISEAHPEGEIMLEIMERIYFLKSVPMFSQLSGEELKPVAEMFSVLSVSDGTTVFKENEPGDSFYVILSGMVRLDRGGREICLLKEKDYFGEMALLDQEARSARAIAATDCELLKLNREDFLDLLEEYPRLSQEIIRTLARRLRTVMGELDECSWEKTQARPSQHDL